MISMMVILVLPLSDTSKGCFCALYYERKKQFGARLSLMEHVGKSDDQTKRLALIKEVRR
jgi:hypothetical protein